MIQLTEAELKVYETMFPVFDVLEALLKEGHYIKQQEDRWHIFDPKGESICSGESIRKLCINLVMSR